MDTEHKGNNLAGIVVRGFYCLVGVVYAGLSWSAVTLVTATGNVTPGDRPEQRVTARSFSRAI